MRGVLLLAAWAAGLLLNPGQVLAQSAWPDRPIRFVVPFAPGGNTDSVARTTAEYLRKALNTNIIIENRGGAGGIVGTEAVARAAPDGYTFCVCSTGSISISPVVDKLSYDPLRDLIPISIINTNPEVVLVKPTLPVRSIQELIAHARRNPNSLTYSSSGVGGLMHFAVRVFEQKTGTQFIHVPYRGGAPATLAVVAGEVDMVFANMSDALPQMQAGTVRALAVTTTVRSPYAADVPTVSESGVPGFNAESWNGLFAPAGTPQPIVDRLAGLLAEMARSPEIQRSMGTYGSIAVSSTPAEYRQMLRAEMDQWAGVVNAAPAATR
jgi:tripartite-type tricarboxylate transporter receptor subunit TctC